MYICVHMCKYMYICVHTCVHMCTYMYICVHMYTRYKCDDSYRFYLYYFVRARCESCSKYTTGANAIAPMDALGEEMEDFDEDLENTPPTVPPTKTDPPKVSTHALIPNSFLGQ